MIAKALRHEPGTRLEMWVSGRTDITFSACIEDVERIFFSPGFDWLARVFECRSLESYVIDIIESLLLTL